jgi:hypothetical protein
VPESAQKATAALAGRKFAERTVVVMGFSEVTIVGTTSSIAKANISRNTLTSMLGNGYDDRQITIAIGHLSFRWDIDGNRMAIGLLICSPNPLPFAPLLRFVSYIAWVRLR